MMMRRADSQVGHHKPNAEPGSPEYKAQVAEPTMGAIDAMTKPFREAVYRYGYIDVYKAWRAGWTVQQIHAAAKGDTFEYKPLRAGPSRAFHEGRWA